MQKRSTIKCHYTSRLAQVKTAENPMSARLSDDLIMGVTGRVCWDGTYTAAAQHFHSKEYQTEVCCWRMSMAARFIIAKIWKQSKYSCAIELVKLEYIHTVGCYFVSGCRNTEGPQIQSWGKNPDTKLYTVNHFASFHIRFQARQNSSMAIEFRMMFSTAGGGQSCGEVFGGLLERAFKTFSVALFLNLGACYMHVHP